MVTAGWERMSHGPLSVSAQPVEATGTASPTPFGLHTACAILSGRAPAWQQTQGSIFVSFPKRQMCSLRLLARM